MAPLGLQRVAVRSEGCFGVLLHNGLPFAVSLERTYPDPTGILPYELPIIPVGVHRCERTHFARGGYDTYEIMVLGHSRLLFHVGNVENDSEGCVLVAESFGELHGVPAVLSSHQGFSEFMSRFGSMPWFDMEVK